MWVRVPPPSLPRKGLLWLCERLKGNMRRELRNEKYPFNCTDFASPNLRIYIVSKGARAMNEQKIMRVLFLAVPLLLLLSIFWHLFAPFLSLALLYLMLLVIRSGFVQMLL